MEIGTDFESQCSVPSYIASTYDIANIPNYAFLDGADRETRLWGNPLAQPAIEVVQPGSDTSTDWIYIAMEDMPQHLPLNQTLLVECPVPACVFPISGYYGQLSRALFYVNMFVAVLATLIPLLRGIAQIWLSTFTATAAFHFLVMQICSSPQIYNLDIEPAVLTVHLGMYSALFWFFTKGDHGTRGAVAIPSEPEGAVRSVRTPLARFWGFARTVPFAFYYLLWIRGTIALAQKLSAGVPPISSASIVLDLKGDYRLTSNCYADAFGTPHMWDTTMRSSIRRLSDVLIYEPPSSTLTSDALLVISDSNMRLFHIGAALWCVIVILLSPLFAESWLGGRLAISFELLVGRCLSITQESHLGGRLLPYLPGYFKGRRSSWSAVNPYHRELPNILTDCNRLRLLLILLLFGAATAAIIIIVSFEQGLSRNNIPEGELLFEVGQWGPWVTTALVFGLVTGAKLLDVDFDPSERSRLHWLWSEPRENSTARENENTPPRLLLPSRSHATTWGRNTGEAIERLL